jgi:hypothetical protein
MKMSILKRLWLAQESGFIFAVLITPVIAVVLWLLISFGYVPIESSTMLLICVAVITVLMGMYRYQHRRYEQQKMLLERIPHPDLEAVLKVIAGRYYAWEEEERKAKIVLKSVHSHDPDLKKFKDDYTQAQRKKEEAYKDFYFLLGFLSGFGVRELKSIQGYKSG